MNASEIMATKVFSCNRHDSLDQVARLMWENDCGAIPVVNEQQDPVGIITDRDIAMSTMLNHRPAWELTAGDLITHQTLHTCTENDPIDTCLALMQKYSIRRVPVVNHDGHLSGMISMGDAIAFTTGNSSARGRTQAGLKPEQTLAMLRTISAHHAMASVPLSAHQA